LLDELDTVLKFAKNITWQGKLPVVKLVTTIHDIGMCLTQTAMVNLETLIKCLSSLEKWFVEISATTLIPDI